MSLVSSQAAADEGELLVAASARIETNRKSDARITVVSSSGKPVSGARVQIEQTSHEFLFGSNIFLWGRSGNEADEAVYRARFSEVFNFATLAFYWPTYERRRGQPDHDRTEQIARWCKEQSITPKGHPLAWNFMDPRWLPDDSAEVRKLQMARIDDCVSRFKGLIDVWDCVNEATHFERDGFRQRAPKMTSMWEEAGRIEFVKECFQHARNANQDATLLINDYRTDAEYEALIEQLVDESGQPIYDAIGIQSHQHRGTWTNQQIWDACERFARFGVPLHFTEMTILSGQPGWEGMGRAEHWPSTEEGEKKQASEVERIYTMLFSHPAVEAITWWDFSDRNAWQGAPAGLIREDMSPKPAYDRLLELVRKRWWTRETGQTDGNGVFSFRGFRGNYRVTITDSQGAKAERQVTLTKESPGELQIRL
jgi:GH35 family endo-1,4-beta-xylanase